MGRLTNFIERNGSGKKVLVLFILTNVVYVLMLTVTIPYTMKFSNGMKLLDMMPTGYDSKYVYELFGSLGEKGRLIYLTNQIPVDMLYPLLFGLAYCLLLAYFLKRLNRITSPYIFLCLLPIIAGTADYLENIGIIAMLKSYPDLSTSFVKTINVFSIIKSISTSTVFMVLLVLVISLGFSAINRKKQ
ncbi:hypothetical protein K8352_02285 [Flavobacteriaceae bacterium F89]|uniref:Uncharacterized protein n=1 Tax=Cerina litoralis TaxID=2874477 RepID=A0AAE3JRF0_9FLAO|nr:hypothetical protein [Cerina litoralis]MCG2459572.1 hypothetical protein [Cerina litoralis]